LSLLARARYTLDMPSQSDPNMPDAIKLAIYDMDKTVTRRATYNGFLLHMARNHAPWRLLLLPVLLFGLALYYMKFWSRSQLKQFSQTVMIGRRVKREDYDRYLGSHADTVLRSNIYPQIKDRLRSEKADGYRHIMATASYRLYVTAIADRLNFDAVIATELVTDDNGYIIAEIDGENCYEMAKLDKVTRWLDQQQIDRAACYIRAYSDHVSDWPLLDYADEAFATNPHEPLLEMALAKGWQIIDWR